MKKPFTKILVPVNFNRNTHLALQKAVQVANEFSCDIHLLHAQLPVTVIPFLYDGHLSGSLFQAPLNRTQEKLRQLAGTYAGQLKTGLQISSSAETGSWQEMTKKTIIAEHIDLVLVPRRGRKIWGALINKININKLAQQTQCPVLTINRQFNIQQLRNILVPVGENLPVRKLSMATYLARKTQGCIHLVSSGARNRQSEKKQSRSIIRAYQILSDYTSVNLHVNPEPAEPGMQSTLSTARSMKADLIVVDCGNESRPAGWLKKLTGRNLYKESNIPVLTVAPINFFT